MQEIIEKSKKLTSLLEELQTSKKVEALDYHLVKDEAHFLRFGLLHLVDLKTEKIVVSGTQTRIDSYCNLRNINKNQILFAH